MGGYSEPLGLFWVNLGREPSKFWFEIPHPDQFEIRLQIEDRETGKLEEFTEGQEYESTTLERLFNFKEGN